MNRFWNALENSTVVSGYIAMSVVSAIVYLSLVGSPIPELLGNASLLIIGYFFGAKVTVAGYRALRGKE